MGARCAAVRRIADLLNVVLDLETTHNRPDLLGVYGIAREVAAIFDTELAPPPGAELGARRATSRWRSRSMTSTAARGTSAACSGTSPSAPSPHWLKARLLAAGMRPISNVVDVTNYVMHALGSPLHAFDFDTLAGGQIGVRRSKKGEKLRTLDGQERELQPEERIC